MDTNKVFKSSMGFKLAVIVFLAILLLIPTFMIMELVKERESRKNEAITEVGSKWGGEQTLAGPILAIPYRDVNNNIEQLYFLPSKLTVKGDIVPQILQRGIYKITAYKSTLEFAGEFTNPYVNNLGISQSQINWDQATLLIGISDMRGLNEKIEAQWDGQNVALEPINNISIDNVQSKAGAKVVLSDYSNQAQIYKYSFSLQLNGVQSLNFIPVGSETTVALNSSWGNPSFYGSFLPDEREVGENGFKANWKILEVNRNFGQQWTKLPSTNITDSAFGVKLLSGVDEYQKITRSIKYAIMTIILTFLIFFFIEVLNKKRVHPLQYILVGSALVLFFSLLLALSEHIGFNPAYLSASIATILAITLYSSSIFKSLKLTLLQSAFLIIIYVFIFIIIQLQDYALLVGNIGLFVVLVIIMFISRKVDWYAAGAKDLTN
ncbi:MAG TPA: cell envelope integrity protein CreD [Patescibacteria group bacterium]|nr:cell envelope integrity protein CreD [Patescibacteria group bacterium]